VIEELGFADYFLIVADIVRFAKEAQIPVGPGRGSAAGSLVAYCLGITEVDPLRWGLLFERFLNKARASRPDVDLDFCYERRGEVLAYVAERFGQEHVARLVPTVLSAGVQLPRKSAGYWGKINPPLRPKWMG